MGDGANNALQSINLVETLGDVAELDLTLVSAPTFAQDYFTLNSKGEFYLQSNHSVTACPYHNTKHKRFRKNRNILLIFTFFLLFAIRKLPFLQTPYLMLFPAKCCSLSSVIMQQRQLALSISTLES